MERIKNILQRLQELYYSKHQKSAIDVDLMMDYTRVMYADLLEWRGQFKEPITTESAEKNTEVITSEVEHEETQTPEPATEAAPAEEIHEEVAESEPDPKEEKEEEKTEEVTPEENTPAVKDAPMQPEVAYKPIERDEPPAREPVEEDEEPIVEVHPEQEQVNTLLADATGISFEPPAQKEVISEVKEDVEIEAPAVNQPVEEIAAPAPVEIPLPDMMPPRQPEKPSLKPEKPSPQAQLFHAAKAANKDIRGSIGINDKYLFLNELFNNHKSNYEETLDKLNHFSTLAQAEDWIITKVAPAQKWDKDDATVQSFYAMLAKHFSDR
jgi:hypothetical protein